MTWPPSARRSATGRPQRRAAAATNHARAWAAAWRSGWPWTWIEPLAIVGPWLGASAVLPRIMRTWSRFRSSSSATSWASAVARPVPRSTWPCRPTAQPSSHSASSNSGPSAGSDGTLGGWPGEAGSAAGGARQTCSTPPAACASARQAQASARGLALLMGPPQPPAPEHTGPPHAAPPPGFPGGRRSGRGCATARRGSGPRWARPCAPAGPR